MSVFLLSRDQISIFVIKRSNEYVLLPKDQILLSRDQISVFLLPRDQISIFVVNRSNMCVFVIKRPKYVCFRYQETLTRECRFLT